MYAGPHAQAEPGVGITNMRTTGDSGAAVLVNVIGVLGGMVTKVQDVDPETIPLTV
jgi:hypothetical protein